MYNYRNLCTLIKVYIKLQNKKKIYVYANKNITSTWNKILDDFYISFYIF